MLLVGAVGVALGVFLVFIGLTRRDAAVPADEYQFDYQAPSERAPQTPREVFRGATAVFERAIAGRQRGNKVAEDLARADLKLRPSEYFLIIAGSMAAFFLVSFAINRNLLVSIIFGAVGFFVPGFYVRYRQSRRMRALSNQLGDTILLLSNALKAGYSFAQAMATIAKSAPHPMS